VQLTKKSFIKVLTTVVAILAFFIKRDLSRYTTTIIDVMDAGKDSGMTVLSIIDSFKDRKLSPEELLELAEQLTSNKRSLDKALDTLIKDLTDYAIETTGKHPLTQIWGR